MPGSAAPSALLEYLPRLGLEPSAIAAVLAADSYARTRVREARERLAPLCAARPEPWRHCAAFALGSLGRREASPESDLDLALLFDGDALGPERAEALRDEVIAALRPHFDIPQKTFASAVDLRSLTRNIGGRGDSNDSLTYRALLLTEGAWLAGTGRSFKRAVFSAYADSPISRGRFLASLGNDFHRYYRTLCMDYRYKVDVLDKSWAIRVLKLRHSRKLWHLANIALQCWAVDAIDDDAERDVALASRIGWPSLLRLCLVLDHFGALELAREPLVCFDRFLAALGDHETRVELSTLDHRVRMDSPTYAGLYANAVRLDRANTKVVELLFERCRPFLVRFCLL